MTLSSQAKGTHKLIIELSSLDRDIRPWDGETQSSLATM